MNVLQLCGDTLPLQSAHLNLKSDCFIKLALKKNLVTQSLKVADNKIKVKISGKDKEL